MIIFLNITADSNAISEHLSLIAGAVYSAEPALLHVRQTTLPSDECKILNNERRVHTKVLHIFRPPHQCRGHIPSVCAGCFLSSRVSQQLQRKEPWHRFSALNLCRGKTSLPYSVSCPPRHHRPLPVPFLSCLYSLTSIWQPLLFYLPQITLALHYPCSFFAPLVFGSDPTTALQCRGRCVNKLHTFLPSNLQSV